MEQFTSWLLNELGNRGWGNAELCARARINSGTLSNILGGNRKIGVDVARKIALALGHPEQEVFRRAGLMTEGRLTEGGRTLREVIEKTETLTTAERQGVSKFIDFVIFSRSRTRSDDPTSQKNDLVNDPGTTK